MAPDRTPRQGRSRRARARLPAEQLDDAILRSKPELDALEVAAETGLTIEQTRRLWRALGSPEFVGPIAET